MRLTFVSPLWQWEARSDSWWFVTVPADESDELAELPLPPRGFGSIRVRATIGGTTWTTSVFPSDRGAGGYVLPLKKAVRKAEGLGPESTPEVTLETVDH